MTINVDNTKPDIEIDKTVRLLPDGSFAKTAFAHVDDTVEYRFEVTNPGVGESTVVFGDPALRRRDADGPDRQHATATTCPGSMRTRRGCIRAAI